MGTLFYISYTVLKGNSDISKNEDTSLWNFVPDSGRRQEAQLSPSDRAMRLVSSNLASCHATVQKLLSLYDES